MNSIIKTLFSACEEKIKAAINTQQINKDAESAKAEELCKRGEMDANSQDATKKQEFCNQTRLNIEKVYEIALD